MHSNQVNYCFVIIILPDGRILRYRNFKFNEKWSASMLVTLRNRSPVETVKSKIYIQLGVKLNEISHSLNVMPTLNIEEQEVHCFLLKLHDGVNITPTIFCNISPLYCPTLIKDMKAHPRDYNEINNLIYKYNKLNIILNPKTKTVEGNTNVSNT